MLLAGFPVRCEFSHPNGTAIDTSAKGRGFLPRKTSATFSATIITGALMFPLGRVGKTEASTTRKL